MWVFFRDDGFGLDPKGFSRLLTTFARNDQKLNAAAISGLVTEETFYQSIPYSYQASPFLQLVTNGFMHKNHEAKGMSEYGGSRKFEDVKQELIKSRENLEEFSQNFFPCFVPPWNHFDAAFDELLPACGYRMISRDQLSTSSSLPEFGISLDFHVRKEKHTAKDLFSHLARAHEAGTDFVGIGLRHAELSSDDLEVIDGLLKNLSKRSIQTVFFSDMLPGFEQRLEMESGHL